MNAAATVERLEPEAPTPFQQRAGYHLAVNGFAFEFPPVPVWQFLRERAVAFDPLTPTGPIALDSSDALGTAYPATKLVRSNSPARTFR